jgi:dATP pyrophosphohydrolase
MPRAPLQVMVLPFRIVGEGVFEYAVLRRNDNGHWQGVAGGGEDDESPAQAARRETQEEIGLDHACPLFALESKAIVPVHCFADRKIWPEDLTHVPEYAFAVDATGAEITLSEEHSVYRWLCYEEAAAMLTYDSNRAALKELHERLNSYQLDSVMIKE